MRDLSVLIPARNEEFLARTVVDVLEHSHADTEVIVVLDGAWPPPGAQLPQHERVQVVYHPQSVGQRAATNEAARLSRARFVCKLDAHCSVAPGWDVELIRAAEKLPADTIQIPAMKNLHVFNWVCSKKKAGGCDWIQYQGPTPRVGEKLVRGCPKCGAEVERKIVWRPRPGTKTQAWRFDADLHFRYFPEFRERPESKGDLTPTMCCIGACFFLSREFYQRIGGLDEQHGSWGQVGVEMACKAWLSGGQMVTNRRTWIAHLFRTQGGDFGFPYEISNHAQDRAREYSRQLWRTNAWPGQVRPLSWLVDRFWPVPGWTEEQRAALGGKDERAEVRRDTRAAAGRARGVPSAAGGAGDGSGDAETVPRRQAAEHAPAPRPSAGVVYYSDLRGDERILTAARRTIEAADLPIVAVTLSALDWPAARCLSLDLERGYLAMFRQILAGLEALDAEVAFLAEHDVLYHPSHFRFRPPAADRYFYNLNVWKVDARTGHAVTYITRQTSGLCADRKLLVEHYRRRVELVEARGFTRAMGFEPGTHGRPERVDDVPCGDWRSQWPNLDIRHRYNLTPTRWKPEEFRSQRSCRSWREADSVPGWGDTRQLMLELLDLGER